LLGFAAFVLSRQVILSRHIPDGVESSHLPMMIRTAIPDDCAAIAHVHIEGSRTTYRGIVNDDYLDALSHEKRTAQWLKNLEQDQITLVAENENHVVVGFADGGPERTGRTDYRGELYAIYLLEECRRQGLGRRLVERIFESLVKAGMDSVLIWVLADNPCRRFYEALGGKLVGEKEIEIGKQRLRQVAYGFHLGTLPVNPVAPVPR
jgi:ribosomal protein S18 acetylase RimI-like enzyme